MKTDEFRCPRCGGHAFGADPVTGRRWCNSDANGQPLSARYDGQLRPGTTATPCGWRED